MTGEGIDYSHPDFRNADGTTRIIDLWDQTIIGNPPEGYRTGTLYSRNIINQALEKRTREEQLSIVPSVDISGHGTHVAGIAAGNGRASNGTNRGVAFNSELLIVKLGTSIGSSFPRTTQLMEAVDFVMRRALAIGLPVVINISFGNNYGSHDGNSLLENYLNDMANFWKSSIILGSGNEGSAAHHTRGILSANQPHIVELAVGENETSFNLQLWKNFYDEFSVEVIAPSGVKIGVIPSVLGNQRFILNNTEILLYYGKPVPYNRAQEIYFEFIPVRNFVDSGIWRFRIIPERIITGNYDMWLPTGEVVGNNTRFLRPVPDITLTIPSTASRVVTVAAYDGYTLSYAPFSGRGFTRIGLVKPDIAAPGVNITSAAPGGGYSVRSGTSMAVPFVTGSIALMMEWGIIRGNDPYLYGEKVKAYLISGARQLSGFSEWPNPQLGYGALCLADSLPI